MSVLQTGHANPLGALLWIPVAAEGLFWRTYGSDSSTVFNKDESDFAFDAGLEPDRTFLIDCDEGFLLVGTTWVLAFLYGLRRVCTFPGGPLEATDDRAARDACALLAVGAGLGRISIGPDRLLDWSPSIRPRTRLLLTAVEGKNRFMSIADSPTLLRSFCLRSWILLVPSISSKILRVIS
jgi:hypothetical protein